MNPNRKLMTILITVLVIASVTFAGFYYSKHFKIDYEIVTDYRDSWSVNYSYINQDDAIWVQAYLTGWDDWNQTFKERNYSTSDWKPDFTNYSYAFLYWGWFPTLSYRINFDQIYFNDGILEFYFLTSSPDGADAMMPSMPKQMVQFENSQLKSRAVMDCEFIWDSSN